jgi:hypothetical protein
MRQFYVLAIVFRKLKDTSIQTLSQTYKKLTDLDMLQWLKNFVKLAFSSVPKELDMVAFYLKVMQRGDLERACPANKAQLHTPVGIYFSKSLVIVEPNQKFVHTLDYMPGVITPPEVLPVNDEIRELEQFF